MGSGVSNTRGCLSVEGSERVIHSWSDLTALEISNTANNELPLHLRGVSGHVLLYLINMPDFDANWTTGDFCRSHILPLTAPHKSSFVRLAGSLRLNSYPVVGTPTRFLSHTWGYPLRRTICAALSSPEGGPDEFYWFDIFCLNQHSNEVGHPDFNLFLRNAMKQTGHTLFVCYPWYKPISITRAWCLYEVMESLKTENEMTFTPILDPIEQDMFANALLDDTAALLEVFINVDVRKASAFLKTDLDMIMDWINNSVGTDSMNSILHKGLCSWIRQAGRLEVGRRESEARQKLISCYVRKAARDVIASTSLPATSEECGVPETVRSNDTLLSDLECEISRLSRRRAVLEEDLNRFEKVRPLELVNILDVSTINVSEENGEDIPTHQIPVLLGTTGHHHLSRGGGVCGGVLPAFLQLLVSRQDFRRDVKLGMDAAVKSETSKTLFHSELRNVCDLWEKARDGIISLDLLIDKLPNKSREMSLEPSDFSEYVSIVINENDPLKSFWPELRTYNRLWHDDEEGIRHNIRVSSECGLYLYVRPLEESRSLRDCISETLKIEEIEGYRWHRDPNSSDYETVTVQRGRYWTRSSASHGRLTVVIERFDLDYNTFMRKFVPTACLIPNELSMSSLEYKDPNRSDESGDCDESDDTLYRPKGILAFRRDGIVNECDSTMTDGVYETYIEVNDRWWLCSEYRKTVQMVSWEMVQQNTLRTAYMVLFESISSK